MRRYPVPALLTATVAALALAIAPPGMAEDKGGSHGIGLPGVPGLPGATGGGGATPGGLIGNGLSGGVGGPSGGLGKGHGGPGGGGGGGVVSPLSPLGGDGPGLKRGRASDLSDLAPGASGRGEGLGLGRLRDRTEHLVDEVQGRARGKVAELRDDAENTAAEVATLVQARQKQAQVLLRDHANLVEPDDRGRPVVRGEILAIAPSAAALDRARAAGFGLRASEGIAGLGLTSVVLLGPRGVSAVEALRRLRALDPAGQYDFNHLYQEGGAVGGKVASKASVARAPAPSPAGRTAGARVGIVDGGVAQGQPALAATAIVQKGFAPGGPRPSPHATAVASLIAGREGPFRGAIPGARLFVADVYGTTPSGGSAEAITRALAWLAETGAPVINISLVGPPNLLLEAAVKALIAKGRLVVAAVGNDGPAAPPLYPAAYPGVIAVTGVDGRRRLLPEASRGSHVDFAAPGSDMAAAGVDGGFVAVRGTSFAAPIAAGLLARYMDRPDRAGAERAIATLGRQALDVGPVGRDGLFGRGLVGIEVRTPPALVQARAALRGP